MSYIGNPASSFGYTTTAYDHFNGDGATTVFTMSRSVSANSDVEVIVNNVVQDPGVAYYVNGTTLTFTGAPSSGTGNIAVIYRQYVQTTLGVGANSISSQAIGLNVIQPYHLGASLTVPVQDVFTANGTGQTFVLSQTAVSSNACSVTVNGLRQATPLNYSVANNVLTFTTAPSNNSIIVCKQYSMVGVSLNPIDGSVTSSKFANNVTIPYPILNRAVANNNLGMNTTPSAWTTNEVALELGNSGNVTSSLFAGYGGVGIVNNAYYNGSIWIYKGNNYGSLYQQVSGTHGFYTTVTSNTAGNTATFVMPMYMNASGNVIITPANVTGTSNWTNGANYPLNIVNGVITTSSQTSWNMAIEPASGAAYNSSGAGLYLNGITNNYGSQPLAGLSSYLLSGGSGGAATDHTGGLSIWTKNAGSSTLTRNFWFDNNANLGVGTGTSTWNSSSKAVELGAYSSFSDNSGGYTYLINNLYLNGSNQWINKTANYISLYQLYAGDGSHQWWSSNTSIGTAGTNTNSSLNNIMTLYNAGTLKTSGPVTATPYYTTLVNLNGLSAGTFYTLIAPGILPQGHYTIGMRWDHGGSGGPYIVACDFTAQVINTNGGGTGNSFIPLCVTHTGSGDYFTVRNISGSSATSGFQFTATFTGNGYITVVAYKTSI